MYYDDDSVFYLSIHRFDNGYFYPGDISAGESYIGKGKGTGYNVNVPLVEGMGDKHYMAVMDHVFVPVLEAYKPELIIISAGFDSAKDDPLGGMNVTEPGYAYMAEQLKSICPRVVICLEGGYNLDVIPKMYYAAAKALIKSEPRHSTRQGYLQESHSDYSDWKRSRKGTHENSTVRRICNLRNCLIKKGKAGSMDDGRTEKEFENAFADDFLV